MRCYEFAGRFIPIMGAIIVAGVFLASHAALAQSDGDEMCSKKGIVREFNSSFREYDDTDVHCTPKGPNGPANGDERCGTTGFVVKYVAKIDTWRNTNEHCGGSSAVGVVRERGQGM